ncbi:phosphoribosylglycinamide formyltransferase [Neorickettsia helminthoeca str. Oregon]|uniref:Phosphoribosylglycinamide formyltransferase n=1 Tax=Neorickettsia helminthoeca str. Oregon TaxID=1286528 RepID=X5H3X0_9RICK|nr:phosphoribosylglycinamide formyltransferase [Neorickettsia helminthoeca]AHX11393.1 phosphoribosylglycinamide formyltransferase [Neorickettsia helminthoeca str. Oregon]
MEKRIAILISGRGSNMKSLLDFSLNEGRGIFKVSVVISNNPTAAGIQTASEYGIEVKVCKSEKEILETLHNKKVALICLAGFMRVLSAEFISNVGCKIINIHPSLLPSFRGLNAQEQALSAGVKIAGCTVHFVTAKIDAGEIIMQGAVPVLKGDTVDSLSERILKMEHKCFPLAVKKILSNSQTESYLF